MSKQFIDELDKYKGINRTASIPTNTVAIDTNTININKTENLSDSISFQDLDTKLFDDETFTKPKEYAPIKIDTKLFDDADLYKPKDKFNNPHGYGTYFNQNGTYGANFNKNSIETSELIDDNKSAFNNSHGYGSKFKNKGYGTTFEVEDSIESNVLSELYDNTSDFISQGINGISRFINKNIRDNDTKSSIKIKTPVTNKGSKYNIIPDSFVGDTVYKDDKRRYILPESIDLNNITLGVRNRGDYTPINTEGAIITNFFPFKKASSIKDTKGTYMGIDNKGNFKIGTKGDFSNDDMVTRTFENELISFDKDENGNQIYKSDKAHGNASRKVPVVNIMQNGKAVKGSINLLTDKEGKGDTYGMVTGGRLVAKADNETRLISGSINDIESQLNDMKKRHNLKTIKIYVLDNGTYNQGFRTKDKYINSKDLKGYDNSNTSGGNFMYIKNQDKYQSDTIKTPNIRTIDSESYKKGHSLTNKQKGVVLHHTAFMDSDLKDVTEHLTNPKSNASSHVVIGYDGFRRVLANPNDVTFHAGQSRWNNTDNVNDFMIGIEFQGDTNKKDLTKDQINSAIEYLVPIIRKNNIKLEDITTHEQVRKLYNDYQKMINGDTAPNKPDINQANYIKIIKALKEKLYYNK